MPRLAWLELLPATTNWCVSWPIECIRRLSHFSARSRYCLPRPKHLPARDQRLTGRLLRRVRVPIRHSPDRRFITGETTQERCGRQ